MERKKGKKAESILAAAEQWKRRCLIGEGSVFTDRSLWTRSNFQELQVAYLANLDRESSNPFMEMLQRQLRSTSPDAKCLWAEMTWMYRLIQGSMGAEAKRKQIATIWNWSGRDFPEGHELLKGSVLGAGILTPGNAWDTHAWREFRFFVVAMDEWFLFEKNKRANLLERVWDFASWLNDTEFSTNRMFRHALLFLLFPNEFEPIVSNTGKRQIVSKLHQGDPIDTSNQVEIDQSLLTIRKRLQKEYPGERFHFYASPFKELWQPEAAPPKSAESSEINEISAPETKSGKRIWIIAPGRDAESWDDFLENEIIGIGWEELGDLRGYNSQEEMETALVSRYNLDHRPTFMSRACWEFANVMNLGDVVIAKKGRSQVVGIGKITSDYDYDNSRDGYGSIRKVEWLKEGRWDLGFHVALKTLTDITNRTDQGQKILEIMGMPELALEIYGTSPPEESADAVKEDPPPYSVSFDKAEALSDLFMSDESFDQMLGQLKRKKNVILQGPPGVGKTFVCQTLAHALMEEKDDSRIQMVQFHQSYGYEEFIQGLRPTSGGSYVLREGVFYEFCQKAKSDQRPHVFIIDEINRGNLSKILGELMMLIERDKRDEKYAMPLAYSDPGDPPFFVPENVYIVGLMNTADRSLALVDYALRRRFAFVSLKPEFGSSKFKKFLTDRGMEEGLVGKLVGFMTQLNRKIAEDTLDLGEGFCIGHSYFCSEDNGLGNEWIKEVLEFEIQPLLQEYWMESTETAEKEIDRIRDELS